MKPLGGATRRMNSPVPSLTFRGAIVTISFVRTSTCKLFHLPPTHFTFGVFCAPQSVIRAWKEWQLRRTFVRLILTPPGVFSTPHSVDKLLTSSSI